MNALTGVPEVRNRLAITDSTKTQQTYRHKFAGPPIKGGMREDCVGPPNSRSFSCKLKFINMQYSLYKMHQILSYAAKKFKNFYTWTDIVQNFAHKCHLLTEGATPQRKPPNIFAPDLMKQALGLLQYVTHG